MSSDAFRSLFREGMALVEDAAAYLDGPAEKKPVVCRVFLLLLMPMKACV
jgi:hypothetical protein